MLLLSWAGSWYHPSSSFLCWWCDILCCLFFPQQTYFPEFCKTCLSLKPMLNMKNDDESSLWNLAKMSDSWTFQNESLYFCTVSWEAWFYVKIWMPVVLCQICYNTVPKLHQHICSMCCDFILPLCYFCYQDATQWHQGFFNLFLLVNFAKWFLNIQYSS